MTYTPTTEEIREYYVQDGHSSHTDGCEVCDEFNRWLEAHDREVAAQALEEVADWIEGGSPRSWGYEHPCHPGERWEPTEVEKQAEVIVDALRGRARSLREEA